MPEPLRERPSAAELPRSSAAAIVQDGSYLRPPEDKDGKIWVRTTALVQADAQQLYRLWRDVEAAPQWQEQIVKVVKTGEKTSRWIMRTGDQTIDWDSEILADDPPTRIAWRSIHGDSNNAGEVVFEAAPGGRGTIVVVLQEFRLGKLANTWKSLTGRSPKQAVVENLRHFKALAETGEIPRTEGQSHGPRGVIGALKQSAYGEKVPTPPGNLERAS